MSEVTAENLTAQMMEDELRRLTDIPGIFEQARDTADRRLMADCFIALEYEDRHWIRDNRWREPATRIAAAINASREGSK